MRTLGVEEELLLVDLDTGVPVALADPITRPNPAATRPVIPRPESPIRPASAWPWASGTPRSGRRGR